MLKVNVSFKKLSLGTFHPFYSSSLSPSLNPKRTRTLSVLLLWLSLPSRPHSLFPEKTRILSLLPVTTVSARQGPLPGHLSQCRHRTVTPDPGLVSPESFMEGSWSAGALKPCKIIHDFKWHKITFPDLIWPYMTFNNLTWPWLTKHQLTWPYITLQGLTWTYIYHAQNMSIPYISIHILAWPCKNLHNHR